VAVHLVALRLDLVLVLLELLKVVCDQVLHLPVHSHYANRLGVSQIGPVKLGLLIKLLRVQLEAHGDVLFALGDGLHCKIGEVVASSLVEHHVSLKFLVVDTRSLKNNFRLVYCLLLLLDVPANDLEIVFEVFSFVVVQIESRETLLPELDVLLLQLIP